MKNIVRIERTNVTLTPGMLLSTEQGAVFIVTLLTDGNDSDNDKLTFVNLSTGDSYFNQKGYISDKRTSIIPHGFAVVKDDVVLSPDNIT